MPVRICLGVKPLENLERNEHDLLPEEDLLSELDDIMPEPDLLPEDDQMVDLAEFIGVKYRKDFLNL